MLQDPPATALGSGACLQMHPHPRQRVITTQVGWDSGASHYLARHHSPGDDAVRRCGHDDRYGIRRVRRTRNAWHITHLRALSVTVSRDDEVLSLLDRLPPAKRQPNLLFGVVRFLGGPVEDPAAFHDYVVTSWPVIEAEMRTRATQTNEAGRCAVLLPVLAALPQPLALLDVGASARCLYPDKYSYVTAPTRSAKAICS